MNDLGRTYIVEKLSSLEWQKLTPEQVQTIDRFFVSVGDYGEVDLIVENGGLKYIDTTESHTAQTSDEFSGAGYVLKRLNVEQIRRIDEMIVLLGESGELQLIVQHGELRFINKKVKHPAEIEEEEY